MVMEDVQTLPERVIAGRSTAPEIVVNKVVMLPLNSNVLDLGVGDARLANSVNPLRPDIRIIGLDYDFSLTKSILATHPGANLVNADAKLLPFSEMSMDMVVLMNTLHEVCSSPVYEERLLQLKNIVLGVNRVLKNKGELVIFDGVDTLKENSKVLITPTNEEAKQKLEMFRADYPAHTLQFSDEGDSYRSNLLSVVLLQTKYGYLGLPVWEGEKNQLYPFLKQQDMVQTLKPFFGETRVTYPQGRVGVEKFLGDFKVVEERGGVKKTLDVVNFPQTQIFIHAIK